MVKEYEDLLDNMRDTSLISNISISGFEPTKIKLEEEYINIENSALKARYSFDMDYKGTFVKKTGDNKKEKEHESKTGGNITFKYVDGKWYIVSMYMNSIYMYF